MNKHTEIKKDWEKEFDDKFKDGEDPFGFGITSIISKYGKPQKIKIRGKKGEYTMQGYNEAKVSEVKQFIQQKIKEAEERVIEEVKKEFVDNEGSWSREFNEDFIDFLNERLDKLKNTK